MLVQPLAQFEWWVWEMVLWPWVVGWLLLWVVVTLIVVFIVFIVSLMEGIRSHGKFCRHRQPKFRFCLLPLSVSLSHRFPPKLG